MPIFDYFCEKCQKAREDVFKKSNDTSQEICCDAIMTQLIPGTAYIHQTGYSYNTSERDIPKKGS